MSELDPNKPWSNPTRSEPPAGAPSPAAADLKGKTLLVVDDEPDLLDLEVQLLGDSGFRVLQSGSVGEALRMAEVTTPIHLLLTDYSLPDRNGIDLARQFRQLHPQAAILLVSGSVAELAVRAGGLERFAAMEKPFTLADLLRKVQALLADTTPPSPPGYLAPLATGGQDKAATD